MKRLQFYTMMIKILLKISQSVTKKLEQIYSDLLNKQIYLINQKSYK
jgi:hypothetical protein